MYIPHRTPKDPSSKSKLQNCPNSQDCGRMKLVLVTLFVVAAVAYPTEALSCCEYDIVDYNLHARHVPGQLSENRAATCSLFLFFLCMQLLRECWKRSSYFGFQRQSALASLTLLPPCAAFVRGRRLGYTYTARAHRIRHSDEKRS